LPKSISLYQITSRTSIKAQNGEMAELVMAPG
jgi:hypothetical protein